MKVITFLIISIGAFTFWSCEQNNDQIDENIIAVKLSHFETYEYNTGISGDEEGAFISKQAEHYEVSKIVRDSTTQWWAVYKYKPLANYVGNDKVEIETQRGSDGASPSTEIKQIKIKFTIY